MLKKMKRIAAATMLLSLVGTGTAFAATETAVTGTTNATITGFTAGNFEDVTLDGTTKNPTSTLTDTTLIDARGTGDGWSVKLEATKFTSDTTSNAAINTLPDNSLALGAVSIVGTEGSSLATDITIGSDTKIDKVGGVTILDADINEGMGTYTVKIAPMTLTLLPKDAKAGTYTSTITMTIAQGPIN